MPTSAVGERTSKVDKDANVPSIWFNNGAALKWGRVISITQNVGINPGTCEIAFSNLDSEDETIPITLSSTSKISEENMKYYSRCIVQDGSIVLFNGFLTGRIENSRSGITTLNYSDDRITLSKIPIVGAWVKDPYTDEIKYINRYLPIFNPGGYRNCTIATINSQKIPIFTWQAEVGMAGKSSDEAGDGKNGVSCFWTSKRVLDYLRYYCNNKPPEVGTINNIKFLNPIEIEWPEGTTSFNSSLMNERIPELSIIGMSLLGAIHQVLEISSEYGLTLEYASPYNRINFYKRDIVDSSYKGLDLTLRTSGDIDDDGFTGIHEYQVMTDASDIYTGVRVEGAPYQVESSFKYIPGGTYGYGTNGTLVPGWTELEGEGFREMIKGDGSHARVPLDPSKPTSSWILMDGSDGNPTILAKTSQAIAMARACFPKAYRAFRIASDSSLGSGSAQVETMLKGIADKYKDYPRLNISRMPYPEQLQPYYEDAGDLRGRIRYPIRIRVATNDSDLDPHDITANSGLRVTDDGLIWLDGITDESETTDRIYEGSFLIDPDKVKLKYFYMNFAIAGDVRVSASNDIFDGTTTDVRGIKKYISTDAFDGKHKGMEFYVLDPDGYNEEIQMTSEPSPAGRLIGADGTFTEQPITRYLRQDVEQIKKHSLRRIKNLTSIKRGGDIRFPTIRTDLYTGKMIGKIKKLGTDNGDWDCERPIKRINFNYENQETSIELE